MGLFFFSSDPAQTTPGVEMAGLDLIKHALRTIRVLNAIEDPSGEDADVGLTELNLILDRWNAKPQTSFATVFASQALTPNLSPHTIGPSGTIVVSDRPVRLDGANLIIANNIRVPIELHDAAWYRAVTTPALVSSVPRDLYYEPSFPNGSIYLWPVPNTAYSLELWRKGLLSAMGFADILIAPMGYRDALVKTLAEALVLPMNVPMPETLPQAARDARATIFANNEVIPTLTTRDAGMPGSHGGGFDYRTGFIR